MCEIFFAQVAFNKDRKLFSEGAQTLFKQSCRLMHLQSQALIVLNEIILCFKRFGAQLCIEIMEYLGKVSILTSFDKQRI